MNLYGLLLSLLALSWFAVKFVSTQEIQETGGVLSPLLVFEIGWPLSAIHCLADVEDYSANYLWLLSSMQAPKIYWLNLILDLSFMVSLVVSCHSMGKSLDLARIMSLTAFCAWFVYSTRRMFLNNDWETIGKWYSERLGVLFLLVFCLQLATWIGSFQLGVSNSDLDTEGK